MIAALLIEYERTGDEVMIVKRNYLVSKERTGNIWVYKLPGSARRVVVFDANGDVTRND